MGLTLGFVAKEDVSNPLSFERCPASLVWPTSTNFVPEGSWNIVISSSFWYRLSWNKCFLKLFFTIITTVYNLLPWKKNICIVKQLFGPLWMPKYCLYQHSNRSHIPLVGTSPYLIHSIVFAPYRLNCNYLFIAGSKVGQSGLCCRL